MMMRAIRLLAVGAALAASAVIAGAQGVSATAHRRLAQALDAPTYRAVTMVFDSARARGIPVEPLVNRVFQAMLHKTPDARIRDAVSTLADRLVVSRAALGPASTDAELSAGANALAVGVPRETLAEIRAVSAGRPVTVPLGVLTELVARRVTVGNASKMVVALLRNGATASQLVSLNDDVKRDVDAGIAPGAAFDVRTRSALGTLEQGTADAERSTSAPTSVQDAVRRGTPAGRVPRMP